MMTTSAPHTMAFVVLFIALVLIVLLRQDQLAGELLFGEVVLDSAVGVPATVLAVHLVRTERTGSRAASPDHFVGRSTSAMPPETVTSDQTPGKKQ
ncbi:MAG: hypothetical protein ACRDRG_01530 [Pseudonocardiaceae bacterium]